MLSRNPGLPAFLLAAMLITLCFGFGCGDDSSTGPDDGDATQDSINHETSLQLVAEANDSLGAQLNEIINETIENADSSFRPGDIDFSGVYNLYHLALNYWPDNPDAKFGCAFTGLMLYLADDGLNALVEDFKHYYDTMSFNPLEKVMLIPEVSAAPSGKMFPAGIPTAPGGFLEIVPALTTLDKTIILSAGSVPLISDIQDNLENNLLPKIDEARQYLTDLIADPEYTFTITPEMQGNPGASPIVLDRSDFSLFLGVAYAADAALQIFFARNLDIASYDAQGVEDAVNQDSDFLTLKGSGVGQSHMTLAKSRLLSAEAQAETTVDYLLAEIGSDQTYDLIKVYESDIDDLNDIKDSLIHYRSYMDGVKQLNIYYNEHWYFDGYSFYYTRDTLELDVDLKQFFDNPMRDPKDFIPGYTVTLNAYDDYYKTFAAEHFDRQRYWDVILDEYGLVYPYDTSSTIFPYFTNHLPDENTDEFYELLGGITSGYSYRQFVYGWDDMIAEYGEGASPYDYYSANMWVYLHYYRYTNSDLLEACFEWEANSFEEWSWPDPTFNGLIPSMTNSQLKDLLLDDNSPEDWDKSGCDMIDFDFDRIYLW